MAIIDVVHQKGGVGKTTIAINLACMLDAPILDLDNQHSAVLFNRIRMQNSTVKPLECFTADDENELRDILKKFKNKMLIIDSGGYDSTLNRLAMILSDFLITPVSPSQVELFGVEQFEGILKKASAALNQTFRTNVIINNADIRSKSAIRSLETFIATNQTHMNLLKTILHNRADFKKSYGEGLSVAELDKNSKATFEMNQLVKEIKKTIKENN